jgi:hypothetical protein
VEFLATNWNRVESIRIFAADQAGDFGMGNPKGLDYILHRGPAVQRIRDAPGSATVLFIQQLNKVTVEYEPYHIRHIIILGQGQGSCSLKAFLYYLHNIA